MQMKQLMFLQILYEMFMLILHTWLTGQRNEPISDKLT